MDNRIEELRKEIGLTQGALAKRLNISQSAVARWEKGISEPSIGMLMQLSVILKAPIDYMVFNTEVRKPIPTTEDNVAALYSRLKERDQDLVYDMMLFLEMVPHPIYDFLLLTTPEEGEERFHVDFFAIERDFAIKFLNDHTRELLKAMIPSDQQKMEISKRCLTGNFPPSEKK